MGENVEDAGGDYPAGYKVTVKQLMNFLDSFEGSQIVHVRMPTVHDDGVRWEFYPVHGLSVTPDGPALDGPVVGGRTGL